MSNRKRGSGVIIASTMPRTAIGTANWRQLPAKAVDAAETPAAGFAPARAGGLAGTRTLGVMYYLLASSTFLA
jgi:hypothetical protein